MDEKLFKFYVFGFLGVVVLGMLVPKFMQYQIINGTKNNPVVTFLTRDISDEGREYGPRIFTIWNLSHVLYFALGAYLFPQYILELWIVGLLWEIGEHFLFQISNPLDILWNTIGIFIGITIRDRMQQ